MTSIRDRSATNVKTIVRFFLNLSLIAPLGWIAWKFFSIPSANPAQELNHLFGRIAYYALALNLGLGSLISFFRMFKKPWPEALRPVIAYRRHLGVAGAIYLVTHVGFHFLIEAGLKEGLLAIVNAYYLWAGSIAFFGILILALTSNNLSMRRLKTKWKSLHQLSYPIFVFATAHALMIEKADQLHFGFIALIISFPLLVRLLRYTAIKRKALV